MAWYVYMVECCDKSLYTGVTKDLARRVHQHNTSAKGSKYCRSRRPVRLVYVVETANQTEAQQLEYQLKQLPRLKKVALAREGGVLRRHRWARTRNHASIL